MKNPPRQCHWTAMAKHHKCDQSNHRPWGNCGGWCSLFLDRPAIKALVKPYVLGKTQSIGSSGRWALDGFPMAQLRPGRHGPTGGGVSGPLRDRAEGPGSEPHDAKKNGLIGFLLRTKIGEKQENKHRPTLPICSPDN